MLKDGSEYEPVGRPARVIEKTALSVNNNVLIIVGQKVINLPGESSDVRYIVSRIVLDYYGKTRRDLVSPSPKRVLRIIK